MSSDTTEKPTVVQAEVVQTQPRKRRIVDHCKRFWWLHFIVFVCVVVLVTCLIIFVGIPKIAQSKVDSAVLTVQGIKVTETQPTNYTLSINSTISIDSPTSATVDGFTGVMYLEDDAAHTPFVSINFPQTTGDALQRVNISQPVTVTDLAALTKFNSWLLWNDTVRVTVVGATNVHVPGVSRGFGVNFIKTVTLPGMRGLAGVNVTNSTVQLTADAAGNNFFGTVTVPNYSLMTFELGNVSFNSYLTGALIGTVYLDNMYLAPGNNNVFSMKANISQGPVLTALGQRPYCENGGVLPFQLSGKSVVNRGQNLPYFADALASGNQSLSIDIGGDLKREVNYNVTCSS